MPSPQALCWDRHLCPQQLQLSSVYCLGLIVDLQLPTEKWTNSKRSKEGRYVSFSLLLCGSWMGLKLLHSSLQFRMTEIKLCFLIVEMKELSMSWCCHAGIFVSSVCLSDSIVVIPQGLYVGGTELTVSSQSDFVNASSSSGRGSYCFSASLPHSFLSFLFFFFSLLTACYMHNTITQQYIQVISDFDSIMKGQACGCPQKALEMGATWSRRAYSARILAYTHWVWSEPTCSRPHGACTTTNSFTGYWTICVFCSFCYIWLRWLHTLF